VHPAHPPLLFCGAAEVSGAGVLDAVVVAGADVPFISISGTSLRTSFASGVLPPRGARPSFVAATGWFEPATSAGGGPHTPRRGSLHVMGPVHGWRIA